MNPKIAVVIPAWNEQDTVGDSIQSVFNQDYPSIEGVVVSADNCTDNTFSVVETLCPRYRRLGVMETVNNKARKSGALNQAIRRLSNDIKYVLVLDADTRVAPNAVSEAVKLLERDPNLGAICARTYLSPISRNASLSEKIWWQL